MRDWLGSMIALLLLLLVVVRALLVMCIPRRSLGGPGMLVSYGIILTAASIRVKL